MDSITVALAIICLGTTALCLWFLWLYVMTYKMYITANRDRDRLIRRIGLYHNLPLITPQEHLPDLPPEAVVPPAFRMRKPVPPPNYKKGNA